MLAMPPDRHNAEGGVIHSFHTHESCLFHSIHRLPHAFDLCNMAAKTAGQGYYGWSQEPTIPRPWRD